LVLARSRSDQRQLPNVQVSGKEESSRCGKRSGESGDLMEVLCQTGGAQTTLQIPHQILGIHR
jgi:hypothetical protein